MRKTYINLNFNIPAGGGGFMPMIRQQRPMMQQQHANAPPASMQQQQAGGAHLMMPSMGHRGVLDALRKKFDGFVISESYLRMETVLSNSQNQYNFIVLANPGVDVITENKLDKNDLFACTRMGFFLAQRTIANPGNTELLTFPSNSLLDSTNVTVKDFYTIYNGYLTWQIASTVIYNSFPMYKFLSVPQTQKDTINAVIGNSSAWANISETTDYGPFENQRNQHDGFIQLSTLLQVSGAANNIITVNIAGFNGMKLAPTTNTIQNIIVLWLDGFLIKNAAYMVRNS